MCVSTHSNGTAQGRNEMLRKHEIVISRVDVANWDDYDENSLWHTAGAPKAFMALRKKRNKKITLAGCEMRWGWGFGILKTIQNVLESVSLYLPPFRRVEIALVTVEEAGMSFQLQFFSHKLEVSGEWIFEEQFGSFVTLNPIYHSWKFHFSLKFDWISLSRCVAKFCHHLSGYVTSLARCSLHMRD